MLQLCHLGDSPAGSTAKWFDAAANAGALSGDLPQRTETAAGGGDLPSLDGGGLAGNGSYRAGNRRIAGRAGCIDPIGSAGNAAARICRGSEQANSGDSHCAGLPSRCTGVDAAGRAVPRGGDSVGRPGGVQSQFGHQSAHRNRRCKQSSVFGFRFSWPPQPSRHHLYMRNQWQYAKWRGWSGDTWFCAMRAER